MRTCVTLAVFLAFATPAYAGDSQLSRSLTCQLSRAEVKDLFLNLRASVPGFAKPKMYLMLPAMNLYELPEPITAMGYKSTFVAILPGRILLAVDGVSLQEVVASQKLIPDENPAFPAHRAVSEDTSIVAYKVNDPSLIDKVLVGCEYRMRESSWDLLSGVDQ